MGLDQNAGTTAPFIVGADGPDQGLFTALDNLIAQHRVPVTIAADDFERWLDCSDDTAEIVMLLLAPPREGEFTWHEVSTRVNRVANDDAQLILPITAEQRESEAPKRVKKPAPPKPAPVVSDDGQWSLF